MIDGAIELHRVTITSYLLPDGTTAYETETSGDATDVTYLGLLQLAGQQILHWGDDDG